jgi:hypothetical protein
MYTYSSRTDKLIEAWNAKHASRAVTVNENDLDGATAFVRAHVKELRCQHCGKAECFEAAAAKKNLMFQLREWIGVCASGGVIVVRKDACWFNACWYGHVFEVT